MGKRYLIDSNILIEFTAQILPQYVYDIVSDIIDEDFNITFINKIEVLGYKYANEAWGAFIDQAQIITFDDEVIDRTILIRKSRKIQLPDAIVAASAVANNFVLLTRNTDDFLNIKGLKVENPWLWPNK